MSEKAKQILKKVGGWIIFTAISGLLFASPALYLYAHSGLWNGRQAVCGTSSVGAKTIDLQKIILRSDYWNFQQVAVSGKLSYSPSRETFYLRDGAFSLPLNVSDCQNLGVFEKGETLIAAKGVVTGDDGEFQLGVTELREAVPEFFKVMFGSGFVSIIIIVTVPLLIGIMRLFSRALVFIGLRKPKTVLSPEEAGNKAAGRMLLASIAAPIMWFFNPIIGAGYQIVNVPYNWNGLRSPKRKVAITGIILSIIVFISMTIVSISLDLFTTSRTINLYPIMEGTRPIEPTGEELLEIKPYINNDFYFSVHQPKSWVADEEKIRTEGLLTFEGPEDGAFQGKPFRPKFNVSFIPIAAIGAKNNADGLQAFRTLMLKDAGASLIADESRTLAGGRLDAFLVETIETQEGYKRHVLGLIAAENGLLYITGGVIPEEKWNNRYAQTIRESFRTFQAWRATFAACLKSKGAVLYSAFDCSHCETQKEIFTEGIERLPYVECQQGIDDTAQSDACRGKNITGYPTWEFADGSRLIGVQTLKALSEKTKCPLPN